MDLNFSELMISQKPINLQNLADLKDRNEHEKIEGNRSTSLLKDLLGRTNASPLINHILS